MAPAPSDEEEADHIPFLDGHTPEDDEGWQHFVTDSDADANSDYSALSDTSDGSITDPTLLKLDEIAKRAKEKLKAKKQKRAREEEGEESGDEETPKKKRRKTASGKAEKGATSGKPSTGKKRRSKKTKAKREPMKRGVVYIGHVPYGFFEKQMRRFFKQFGRVTRLRVSRNKHGKSRGYAFVEFADHEVAEIVAKALDGYFIFEKVIAAKMVPEEKVHPMMFKGWGPEGNQSAFHVQKRAEAEKNRKPKTAEEKETARQKRLKQQQDKLTKLGIDYKIPAPVTEFAVETK